MRLFAILFFNLFFLVNLIFAQNINSKIDSANSYYNQNRYEDAANAYSEIIKTGYVSADLYYNLANSYFKLNKITLAILYYEKAKILSPGDEDIIFNLELSNKYIVDKIEVIPEFFITKWIKNFINIFSSNSWAIISIFSFLLFLILLSVYLFSRTILLKKIAFWGSILLLIVSIKSLVFSKLQYDSSEVDKKGIIKTETINIKSSPDYKGTDIFILHEGTKVELLDSIGNWYEIKISNGNKGWTEKENLYII